MKASSSGDRAKLAAASLEMLAAQQDLLTIPECEQGKLRKHLEAHLDAMVEDGVLFLLLCLLSLGRVHQGVRRKPCTTAS
jgi:hypothetical protein